MNINAINLNNISFQKKLRANCCVLEDNKQKNVSIYEIDDTNDPDYFIDLLNSYQWKGAYYLSSVVDVFNETGFRFFVMEDDQQNCLGYCVTDMKENHLEYIGTKPKYINDKYNPTNTKYIGETLLAFVIKDGTLNSHNNFYVGEARPGATGFYRKCGFVRSEKCDFEIEPDAQNKFIAQNEQHTGSKIKLIV